MTQSGTQEKPRRREGIHPGWDAAMEAARADVPKRYPWIQAIIDTQPKVYIGAWWKLAELWELLRAVRPESVIELGTGLTTAVFERYRLEAKATVITQDENQQYQETICEQLSIKMTRVVAKVVEDELSPTCWYGVFPAAPDLLYVDGPDTSKRKSVGVDACRMFHADRFPRYVVFDQRHKSAEAFWKVAKGHYVAHWDCRLPVLRGAPWWLSGLRYHTVFEKVLDS